MPNSVPPPSKPENVAVSVDHFNSELVACIRCLSTVLTDSIMPVHTSAVVRAIALTLFSLSLRLRSAALCRCEFFASCSNDALVRGDAGSDFLPILRKLVSAA